MPPRRPETRTSGARMLDPAPRQALKAWRTDLTILPVLLLLQSPRQTQRCSLETTTRLSPPTPFRRAQPVLLHRHPCELARPKAWTPSCPSRQSWTSSTCTSPPSGHTYPSCIGLPFSQV